MCLLTCASGLTGVVYFLVLLLICVSVDQGSVFLLTFIIVDWGVLLLIYAVLVFQEVPYFTGL